jgi:hypothetical protein
VHGSAAPGDIDLLDYAATMSLQRGGQVTLVVPSSLPLHAKAAALLRYRPAAGAPDNICALHLS